MSRSEQLDLRYLLALTELSGSFRHLLRNHLDSARLQSAVIVEIMSVRSAGDDEAWTKVRDRARTSLKSCDELLAKIERVLAGLRPVDDPEAGLDLRGVIRDVEGLLDPWVHKRRATLVVRVPDHPVTLEGSRSVIQRALLVALLEASRALEPKDTLAIELDADGVLQVRGVPAHQWLPAVADIIELIGAGLDASPQDSAVAIRLPIQTRI